MQSDNLEKAILFDTKDQALSDMPFTEHISRLSDMKEYLTAAVSNNHHNLYKLKEISRAQTSQLQTAYQILQSQTRSELDRLKKIFQPAMQLEKKELAEMKNQVGKINGEQLATKKQVLNCEAMIDHCENQMGFVEMKANNHSGRAFNSSTSN